jgi:hypothetical protein
MTTDDERGAVGGSPSGAVPDDAVPPDPPVGPGVPTRGDTDVPDEERATPLGPPDPLDGPTPPDR